MPSSDNPLAALRARLDEVDRRLLDLLAERRDLVAAVLETKQRERLPIFAPIREREKVDSFRIAAAERGLDPDWAEDFLRMIMGASRASQSRGEQPRATAEPKTVLLVGGRGRMGSLYGQFFAASGHQVRVLDLDNWNEAGELASGCDLAVVTVPIRVTGEVIARLAPLLDPGTLLCDFTSHKADPVAAMLQAHPGPVLGLHPMHGPDVQNLSKQLMVVCPGRSPEAAAWLLDQFRLWGLRLQETTPLHHDETMHLVQGLRHFLALLHGSFLARMGRDPVDMLQLSSPIYRAELMMTGRIFAQNPELYADIVFSDEPRRALLLEFLDHHQQLAELVRNDDKAAFVERFREIQEFFGDFAGQALTESGYLIHRLADRFA
ncbi:MAG: bifunctional chorismate mutase/prephenate dehydrogenase [Lysobacterales bacterium]|nr:MAG: bifunctional chorismate mutase/prephenate dehydrogenase [Xanthomonadales bacterium]